jgi:RND family efflux transporter MFP subunit
MSRRVSISLVVVAIAAVVACNKKAPAPVPKPVKTKAVEVLTGNAGLRYSAGISPSTQVDLAFKVGGYISAIHQVRGVDGQMRHLQGGDVVRKGTVLATVRQGDYRVKVNQAQSQANEAKAGVEAARNQAAQAQSNVNAAKAQLAEAEAAFGRAKLEMERANTLFASRSITKTDYDSVTAQYEMTQAKVEAARANVQTAMAAAKVAAAQVEAMQAKSRTAGEVVNEARIPLGDSTLRAPMDCTILRRDIEVGSLVSSGKVGFAIADLGSVKAVFGVPDRVVPSLKLGMPIKITTDALSDAEFSGEITAISPAADPKSRVFEVEITIPNRQGILKSGMVASIELESGPTPTNILVVPLNAIIQAKDNPNAYAVFVVETQNGKPVAKLRTVKLGDAYGNTIAVVEGLKLGDQVITTGAKMVVENDQVQVVP